MQVLEFLSELFGILNDEGYTLTEAEAAVFLPCLMEKISGQLKCLQLVAGLTSERDGEIRKAALNTMATAYKIIAGEDVWRYVGKLSDAQRSMLDDRFKWKVGIYFSIIGFLTWESLDVAEQSGEVYLHSVSVPVATCLRYIWKPIQVLQSTIYEVDLDRVLQSIHVYLQGLGMEEIRRR
ncbi:hypothetical protein GW17_00022822 [Ensete ventricosum]|nr:hypothetical protein GW17_00022822 [Ensete ventricosum]